MLNIDASASLTILQEYTPPVSGLFNRFTDLFRKHTTHLFANTHSTISHNYWTHLTKQAILPCTLLVIVVIGVFAVYRLTRPKLKSEANFEKKYQHHICSPINLSQPVTHDYLCPNEVNPQDIQEHFRKIAHPEKGTFITTGTERAVFDLLLSDFKCVINVDIEPTVKAYLDYLSLLVRIAKDRQDFCTLAEGPMTEELQSAIRARLDAIDMPDFMKMYYLHNFEKYAAIFYGCPKDWHRDDHFKDVNYYTNDNLFLKFQRYVCEGRFLSVCGDINHLSHFENVVAVDTSNIYFYSFIHPSLSVSSKNALMIWTYPNRDKSSRLHMVWNFCSYPARLPNQELAPNMQQLIDTFHAAHTEDCLRLIIEHALRKARQDQTLAHDHHIFDRWLPCLTGTPNVSDIAERPPTACSPQLHRFLEHYIQTNFYDASKCGLGMVDFGANMDANQKLKNATPEQLQKLLHEPDMSRFLPQLIELMIDYAAKTTKLHVWHEITSIKGFKEAFQHRCEIADLSKQYSDERFHLFESLHMFKYVVTCEGRLADFDCPELQKI